MEAGPRRACAAAAWAGREAGLASWRAGDGTEVDTYGNVILQRDGKYVGRAEAADLAHGFDGWLPLHAAACLALDKETLAVVLDAHPAAASTADAHGTFPLHLAVKAGADKQALSLLLEAHSAAAAKANADGQYPLHLAASAGADKEALSLVLKAHSAAAAMADAGGQYPFQLLPSTASDDAKALLTAAAGDGDTISTGHDPLWKLLLDAAEPEAESPSAEAVRAAVEADPGAAARPFATPAGWEPVERALVRLRPGLGEKGGLRAGDLATVTDMVGGGWFSLKRNGKYVGDLQAPDVTHCFDGGLPLHVAAALMLAKALSLLLEAHPNAAAMADAGGQCPLHLAASAGADKEALSLLLEAHSLTAGTTWHTAGMLWRLRPSYVDIELVRAQ